MRKNNTLFTRAITLAIMTICMLWVASQPRFVGSKYLPNTSCKQVKSIESRFRNTFSNESYSRSNEHSQKASVDQPNYQVNFILDFNSEIQRASQIIILDSQNEWNNFDFDVFELIKGSNSFSIPKGIYDIIVVFEENHYNPNESWHLFVVREKVTIDQNLELYFASEEAKNHIHFQTLTIDGEPISLPKWTFDENWNDVLLEHGNTDNVYFDNRLVCKEYDFEYWHYGQIAPVIESEYFNQAFGEKDADFFINDVSGRWAFNSYRVARRDFEVYTSAYEKQGASGNATITNDPMEFVLYEYQLDDNSFHGDVLYPSFRFFNWAGRYETISHEVNIAKPLAHGDTFKYFIGASNEKSQLGYIPFIQPIISSRKEIVNSWDQIEYEYNPVLTCLPIYKNNEHVLLSNNGEESYKFLGAGFSFVEDYSEKLDQLGRDILTYPFWPSHPVFSYPMTRIKGVFGNNCPALVSDPKQYLNSRYSVNLLDFNFDYFGRYGERRPDDRSSAHVSIKVNEDEFINNQGVFVTVLDELLNGVVDVSIVKDSIVVDNMDASNNAQLHYTAGAEDENPPTLTMLHFKDNAGDVTDRFNNAGEGIIEFSAGDFNFSTSPLQFFYYDRNAPETVEVSYSPYGKDNWNELEVEEVPENYWPTMGWFYTAPLASVTGEAYEGWFDLKIRLEDAAGNWQEQVLSPAFRIDDLAYSSVATVGSNNAHEVARYSIDGKRVDASHRGVTIIKMSDGTARKVLVK